jgi:hypothetical protein
MRLISLLLLGLVILPESIVHIPIFPLGIANAHPLIVNTTTVEKYTNPLECDACMFFANGLNETILHNPKVISIVSDDLEKICSVLPESVQALCTSAAEQTAPILLNHLGEFIATEGCSDLGICHNTKGDFIAQKEK